MLSRLFQLFFGSIFWHSGFSRAVLSEITTMSVSAAVIMYTGAAAHNVLWLLKYYWLWINEFRLDLLQGCHLSIKIISFFLLEELILQFSLHVALAVARCRILCNHLYESVFVMVESSNHHWYSDVTSILCYFYWIILHVMLNEFSISISILNLPQIELASCC